MTKNKANKLLRAKRGFTIMDANNLHIHGELNEQKLKRPTRPDKYVVAFRDLDGKNIVIDGRHAAKRAQRMGKPVRVIFVNEGDMVGRQSVLDRAIGFFLKKKES